MTGDIRKGRHVYRKASIEIPDREENEDSITPNQLRYIKKLAPGIEINGGLENLGKWQASTIIDQIKEKQEELEYDIASGRTSKTSKGANLFWLIVLIILIYLVIKYVL